MKPLSMRMMLSKVRMETLLKLNVAWDVDEEFTWNGRMTPHIPKTTLWIFGNSDFDRPVLSNWTNEVDERFSHRDHPSQE